MSFIGTVTVRASDSFHALAWSAVFTLSNRPSGTGPQAGLPWQWFTCGWDERSFNGGYFRVGRGRAGLFSQVSHIGENPGIADWRAFIESGSNFAGLRGDDPRIALDQVSIIMVAGPCGQECRIDPCFRATCGILHAASCFSHAFRIICTRGDYIRLRQFGVF